MTALIVLTALDLVCTMIGLSCGYVTEANPIMAYLYNWSYLGACTVVMGVVGLFAWYAKQHYDVMFVRVTVYGLVAIKVIVMLIHCVWIIQII